MIKINLLKAVKETSESSGQKEPFESPLGGFFAKIFPPKEEKGDFDFGEDDEQGNPVQIIAKVVMLILIPAGLFYHESINIPRLSAELEEENKKLAELMEYNNNAAASVAEIKKLQEHKVLIEKQIASLDGLSKVRLKYIKALDLIQTNIPDKMWFLSLKSKDNNLEASGVSFTDTEISQFLDAMGKSIYFSDVSMLSSEDVVGKEGDNRKFKKFNLNFVLEGGK